MPDDEIAAEFGARVKKRREALGWSQEALAEQADLGVAYVSDIERGVYNPGLKNVVKIARALGVQVGDLFPPI
jgi:transcriptional regulator with XRE-family HTH domain